MQILSLNSIFSCIHPPQKCNAFGTFTDIKGPPVRYDNEGWKPQKRKKRANDVSGSPGFFHRFCGFNNNRISEPLSLGETSLSLAENPFILMWEN